MAIAEVKENLSFFFHSFLLPLLFVCLFSVAEQCFLALCNARTDRAQGDTSPAYFISFIVCSYFHEVSLSRGLNCSSQSFQCLYFWHLYSPPKCTFHVPKIEIAAAGMSQKKSHLQLKFYKEIKSILDGQKISLKLD